MDIINKYAGSFDGTESQQVDPISQPIVCYVCLEGSLNCLDVDFVVSDKSSCFYECSY